MSLSVYLRGLGWMFWVSGMLISAIAAFVPLTGRGSPRDLMILGLVHVIAGHVIDIAPHIQKARQDEWR
jgi:hypothetical protein